MATYNPKRYGRGESLHITRRTVVRWLNNGARLVNYGLTAGILAYAGWSIAKWIAAMFLMLVFG